MGSGTGLDKPTLEKDWANEIARLKLSRDDRAVWMRLGHTIRPYVYFDKILLVWTYDRGVAQILDVFTVTTVDASFQGGLWIRALSKTTNNETIITHEPRRLAPGLDVFAWVPFFNEVRYVSADWNNPAAPRNLRVSCCLKMIEDPLQGKLRDNQHYLSELHTFRAQHPQFRSTRF